MRLNQIKEDVLYATCDGNMVKPVAPISNKWTRVPTLLENGEPRLDTHGRAMYTYTIDTTGQPTGEVDPWARCTPRQQRKLIQEHGVLVELFDYDEDGRQGASHGKYIAKTSDIGGPWSDYLLLHGEVVQLRGAQERVRRELGPRSVDLRKRMTDTGFAFPVGPIARQSSGDVRSYPSPDSSSLTVEWREHYGYTRYISGPPAEAMHPWLTLAARNSADVDYLLGVLRLGVIHQKSLEKRRAREAVERKNQAQRKPKRPHTAP